MANLQSPIKIRNFTVKNRVVLPPLVICGLHKDGHVNEAVLSHYEAFARGGCGTIIQEATCVLPEGRLAGEQLGIWEDGQIEESKRIADRVLPYGAMLLMQIHYASKQGEPDNIVQVGPSEYVNHDGSHRKLSTAEVERIRDGFISAAVRVEKAGYHGVELHGAHGYLLCAFMNSKYNIRDDRYGDTTQLIREIITGIRQTTGLGFIVTARVGTDNPDMATGIANCKVLDNAGLDLMNISAGMGNEDKRPLPEGFPFSELTWLGCEVKKQVKLPIMAVGDMNVPGQAAKLIKEGWADFACIGRGLLVDPEWANKMFAGEMPNACLDCKRCVWFRGHEKCPGKLKAAKK